MLGRSPLALKHYYSQQEVITHSTIGAKLNQQHRRGSTSCHALGLSPPRWLTVSCSLPPAHCLLLLLLEQAIRKQFSSVTDYLYSRVFNVPTLLGPGGCT